MPAPNARPRLVRVLAASVAAFVLTASTGPTAAVAVVPDPAGTVVLDPAQATPAGVALNGRRLVTGETSTPTSISARALGASGSFAAGPWHTIGANLYWNFCNGTCYDVFASGSKTAYVERVIGVDPRIVIVGPWGVLRSFAVVPPQNEDVHLLALSPSHVAYRLGTQYHLYDINQGVEVGFPILTPQPWNFALAGSTVWTPTTPGGPQVTGVDLPSLVQRTVTLPATCAAYEWLDIQVVGHWMAWGCRWENAPINQGIYDLDTGQNIPLYADYNPRLGDGFLVSVRDTSDGLTFHLIDFTKNPPVRTDLTTMDYGYPFAWEGVRWALDKAGGQALAWVASTGQIHVVPLGVPASPLKRYGATVPAKFTPNHDGVDDLWHPVWEVSKPVTWTLTLRRNGLVMRILRGQSVGAAVAPEWNGMLTGWMRWFNPAANGIYSFTLTMTPADGVGPNQTVTGAVEVAQAVVARVPVPRRV